MQSRNHNVALVFCVVAVAASVTGATTHIYPPANINWANGANPFNAPIVGYGMPCIIPQMRIVVVPTLLEDNSTDGNTTNAFIAFAVDTGVYLWNHTFRSYGGQKNVLQGQYCAPIRRIPGVVVAGGLTVRILSAYDGSLSTQTELPAVPSDLPAPQSPPIVVTDGDDNVYVAYGAQLRVYHWYLLLKFAIGRSVYQHVNVFGDGYFYYKDALSNGHNAVFAASTADGSPAWHVTPAADSVVASASVAMVATLHIEHHVITAYSAITGTRIWETAHFGDYNLADSHFVGFYPTFPFAFFDDKWFMVARELSTGQQLWNTTIHRSSSPILVGSGYVFTHGNLNQGYLTATRMRDGEVAWQVRDTEGCHSYNGVAFESLYVAAWTGSCKAGAGIVAYNIS